MCTEAKGFWPLFQYFVPQLQILTTADDFTQNNLQKPALVKERGFKLNTSLCKLLGMKTQTVKEHQRDGA